MIKNYKNAGLEAMEFEIKWIKTYLAQPKSMWFKTTKLWSWWIRFLAEM